MVSGDPCGNKKNTSPRRAPGHRASGTSSAASSGSGGSAGGQGAFHAELRADGGRSDTGPEATGGKAEMWGDDSPDDGNDFFSYIYIYLYICLYIYRMQYMFNHFSHYIMMLRICTPNGMKYALTLRSPQD